MPRTKREMTKQGANRACEALEQFTHERGLTISPDDWYSRSANSTRARSTDLNRVPRKYELRETMKRFAIFSAAAILRDLIRWIARTWHSAAH